MVKVSEPFIENFFINSKKYLKSGLFVHARSSSVYIFNEILLNIFIYTNMYNNTLIFLANFYYAPGNYCFTGQSTRRF